MNKNIDRRKLLSNIGLSLGIGTISFGVYNLWGRGSAKIMSNTHKEKYDNTKLYVFSSDPRSNKPGYEVMPG